ncbi:multidrug efflux SMR transporter [Pigmentiphaga aceris]|uniref:Guanidinium exporter n=1 Tax=Pigmentiphaga aceris TaxID=1940612 RepID=A0A5C0AWT9_9BURK|nr:multidrug efflux SMR transporter [Pigmentiphaga aceris]QEI06645.1 multidrug efflux SMR transporter [Pigmentiphaga aceris]
MSWLVLLLGGVFEIGFTTCLRYTDGFRNVSWTVGFATCALISFLALEHATKVIPLGTAYAVWTGIGALGTVVIGMIWFSEPATVVRGLLILLLVGSIVGLKITSGH